MIGFTFTCSNNLFNSLIQSITQTQSTLYLALLLLKSYNKPFMSLNQRGIVKLVKSVTGESVRFCADSPGPLGLLLI